MKYTCTLGDWPTVTSGEQHKIRISFISELKYNITFTSIKVNFIIILYDLFKNNTRLQCIY